MTISPKVTVKLNIADIIIEMRSTFPLEQFNKEEIKSMRSERYDNFTYKGKKRPDIKIEVNIVDKLPVIKNTKPVFITYHPDDGKENWRLLKKRNYYIYKSPLEDKKQLMIVNSSFNRVRAYLLPKHKKGCVWNSADIIYDFLQVLLINYMALNKSGMIVHSVGIKDTNGDGLIFAGESGAGKSTIARIWHKHSKAMVLNDDRIIVRNIKGKFLMYGSPWHGEFSDYLVSKIDSALLKNIFFIHHLPKHNLSNLSEKEGFSKLYSSIFPTFWDKRCLENLVIFSLGLIKNIAYYNLGFVNNNGMIKFVRTACL